MRKIFFCSLPLLFLTITFSHLSAQERVYGGGSFGLGIRSTFNYFLEDGMTGLGAGGQWKLGFTDRVNTEWFFDYITSHSDELGAARDDYHIGWSVQFAFKKDGFGGTGLTPYVLGGQCFDLTRVETATDRTPLNFSAAVQAGLGASWFVHPRVEFTGQAQYMVHLGKDVHAETDDHGHSHIHESNGFSFLGHGLLTFSCNVYFLKFWNQ